MLYLKEKYDIKEALVIGDREIDRKAGQAAGFDTLLVDGKKSVNGDSEVNDGRK